MKLRAVGVECGKADAQKTRPVLRLRKHFLHGFLQFIDTGSATIFDDHLETKSVSEPGDRRRRQHGKLCARKRKKSFLKLGQNTCLRKPRWTVIPVLKHDKRREHVSKLCRIERRITADRYPTFDAGDVLENSIDICRNLAQARLRCAGGKPRH